MTLITITKRIQANQRPLPEAADERRKVLLRRIFLDRDIDSQQDWIHRGPDSQGLSGSKPG